MTVSSINTGYDQWYLQNLTNTKNVNAQRYSAAKTENQSASAADSERKYDTFEFSASREELQSRMTEKTRKTEQYTQPETTEKTSTGFSASDMLKRSVDGEEEFPSIEFTGAGAAAQNIGLISLIDSGTIELPEKLSEETKSTEEIKPVERENGTGKTAEAEQLQTQEVKAESSAPQIKIDFSSIGNDDKGEKAPELNPVSRETQQVRDEIESSATLNTSDELAERQSASRVTPSQQQSIQAYQRVQSYTNPVNISMNAAYGVA